MQNLELLPSQRELRTAITDRFGVRPTQQLAGMLDLAVLAAVAHSDELIAITAHLIAILVNAPRGETGHYQNVEQLTGCIVNLVHQIQEGRFRKIPIYEFPE